MHNLLELSNLFLSYWGSSVNFSKPNGANMEREAFALLRSEKSKLIISELCSVLSSHQYFNYCCELVIVYGMYVKYYGNKFSQTSFKARKSFRTLTEVPVVFMEAVILSVW